PVAFGVFGLVYAVPAAILGLVFAWAAFRLWRETTRARAVALFHYSLLYLALLFVAMALDAVASASRSPRPGPRTRRTRPSSRTPRPRAGSARSAGRPSSSSSPSSAARSWSRSRTTGCRRGDLHRRGGRGPGGAAAGGQGPVRPRRCAPDVRV